MRRSMIAAVFAALATAGLCTEANAVPAGPGLLMAKATETSVTQVHWRGWYWPRVTATGPKSTASYRVYRPRVYGYYSPRVYGYWGHRGRWW